MMVKLLILAVLVGALIFLFFRQIKLEADFWMMEKEVGILRKMVCRLDGSEPYIDKVTGNIMIPIEPEVREILDRVRRYEKEHK